MLASVGLGAKERSCYHLRAAHRLPKRAWLQRCGRKDSCLGSSPNHGRQRRASWALHAWLWGPVFTAKSSLLGRSHLDARNLPSSGEAFDGWNVGHQCKKLLGRAHETSKVLSTRDADVHQDLQRSAVQQARTAGGRSIAQQGAQATTGRKNFGAVSAVMAATNASSLLLFRTLLQPAML